MASEISRTGKTRPGFMTLLSSALCEWLLISLLFLDMALSHILTRFAHYCDLKTPCPFCSRLVSKNKIRCNFYSLLCINHIEEVSSLVSCSIHKKLADINSLCEECLGPLATMHKNGSGSGSYRLFLGKSWVDIDRSLLQNLISNKHVQLGSLSHGASCSCCNKTFRAKPNNERLMHDLTASVGLSTFKANIKPPLPRVPGRSRFCRRDSLMRLREKFNESTPKNGSKGGHNLSHVGYTKLKLGSDTESGFPLSEAEDDDDDDVDVDTRNILRDKKDCAKSDDGVRYDRKIVSKLEIPFVFDQPDLLLDLNDINGSQDLSCDKYYNKEDHEATTTESITIDNASQVPSPVPQSSAISVMNELLSLKIDDVSSSDIAVVIKKHADVESANNDTEIEQITTSESAEIAEDSKSQSEEPQLRREDSRNNEVNSQIYATSSSPKTSNVEDEIVQIVEDSKSISKESQVRYEDSRNNENDESKSQVSSETLPSPEMNNNNNIEGENMMDHLKKQVEHYQTCMNSLYKELEEERNAAAIAANEAMAMITRLQEEKASLHMEALQYLRMMEEQAEHDVEALERANDLLAEREKELQDLEAELEFYRNNFPDDDDRSGISVKERELILEQNWVESSNQRNFNNIEDSRTSLDVVSDGNDDIDIETNHESNSRDLDKSDDVIENQENPNYRG